MKFRLLIVILLFSCSGSFKTFSDRDKKVDLKQYKSYAWIAPGDTVLNAERRDKLYGNLIVHSVDTELKKKGMVVDVKNPDALFIFDTRLEEKIQYTQSPSLSVGVGYGGPGYYVGGYAPVAGGHVTASSYEEGLLVIQMYDTKTGKVLWTGGAIKEITHTTDVEDVIKKVVKFVMAELPIKHKTK